jgi:hypothetical protein
MSGLRRFLAEQIKPPTQPVSGSARLAQFARDEKQAVKDRADAEAAAAAEAAKPKPQSLVEELRFELEKHQEDSEFPALNSDALLRIAAGTQEAPRSVREQISGLLRGMWDQREQQP